MHDEFPDVTYDVTIKIEHILEHRHLIPAFAATGCAFIVSAVESLSTEVLRHLRKGHTRQDVVEALDILAATGIPMRPTFVAFTPWTSARDYMETLDFIQEHGLIDNVDPIQFSIRLLIPPGSDLLNDPTCSQWLGELDEQGFTYRWRHPDPVMDTLQLAVASLVAEHASRRTPAIEVFNAIYRLAATSLKVSADVVHVQPVVRPSHRPVPHLSEPWFC